MAFHTGSFFAGAGTVLATIVVGFGGGVLVTNAVVGKNDVREPNRLEQRIADAKAVPVNASIAPASVIDPGQSEQKPFPTTTAEAHPVQSDSASHPVAQAVNVSGTLQSAPEVKVKKLERKKSFADHKKTHRLTAARRQKQKTDELDQVAESVKSIGRERDPDSSMTRAFAAESPFSFDD